MNELSIARQRLVAATLAQSRLRSHHQLSRLATAPATQRFDGYPRPALATPTNRRQGAISAGAGRFLHTTAIIFLRSTPTIPANALRKAAAREKARERAIRSAERTSKRREKDGLPAVKPPSSQPQFEGPNGERLTLAEKEKVLRRELADLSRELEIIEKKEKADAETQELPPLDDQTLDQLYQALMMPLPASAEDQRLARLESGRKEKALISSGVGLMDERQQARLEAQQVLRERLLDARDRGRAMLPLKPSPASHAQRRGREVEEEDEEGDEGMIDLSQLSYEGRQEARLQLLFERLTLLRQGDESEASAVKDGKQHSLRDIKSGLALRIAKLLKERNYLLKPTSTNAEAEQLPPQDDAASRDAEDLARIPAFESIALDRSIIVDSLEPTPSSSSATAPSDTTVDEPHYIAVANEILQDVSSPRSRGLMLDRIEQLLDQPTTTKDEQDQTPSLPLGVASVDEWIALSVACARSNDAEALTRMLKLMRRAGYFPPPLKLFNEVMDAYASRGQIDRCQETLSLIDRLGLRPDLHTLHCLTKAYLTDGQFAQAIKMLNSLEGGLLDSSPASMATYTMAIDRMVDDPREEVQALGWNLFYHMRLVAHPIPDAPLYALMIRACAKGSLQPQDIDDPTRTIVGPGGVMASKRADAERALDLFREMTARYVVRPNAEVYNNLILACARRKDFYLEAFRLLREMVEMETERVKMLAGQQGDTEERAELESAYLRFAPDRYTFNALLQGCARNKDLPRARWVLAEMIRSTSSLFNEADGKGSDEALHGLSRAQRMEMMAQRPNAETLSHVFWAYASFVPPVKKSQMKVQMPAATGKEAGAGTGEPEPANAESKLQPSAATTDTSLASTPPPIEEALTETEVAQVFSHLIPQTALDLVTEARALMARILADQPRTVNERHVEGSLGSVTPSVMLLNAYLAVLAAHLPPALRVETLWRAIEPPTAGREPSLFAQTNLEPNANTLLLLLESATRLKINDRTDEIVSQVWAMFRTLEAEGESRWRLIEKCWCQRIRFFAKANRLDEALASLKEFATLYPPASRGVKTVEQAAKAQRKEAANKARLQLDVSKLERELDLSPVPAAQKTLQTLAMPKSNQDQPTATGEGNGPRPFLTFVDLELLHHRLVRFGHKDGLAYLGWVARAYENSNRKKQ